MQDKPEPKPIQDSPKTSILDVVEKVCKFYNVTHHQIYSKKKKHPGGTLPRQVCAWICKNILGIPQLHVAKHFDMDNSTIVNGVKSVSNRLRVDEKFADELDNLVKLIDPRHRILEQTFKVILRENRILDLPQIADEIVELACRKKIPRVEVTFRLLRGTGDPNE